MMSGLLEGQEKMSKSDPDSAIFMEDEPADVKRKIKKSYCPPGVVAGNPCLEMLRLIVFVTKDQFVVHRKPEDGGDMYVSTITVLTMRAVLRAATFCSHGCLALRTKISVVCICSVYNSYAEAEADFASGKLHPGDLKAGLTEAINALIEPVRKHFASGDAKKLLEQVRSYKTTR
jgi:tyrosyl-tRNA synthetase